MVKKYHKSSRKVSRDMFFAAASGGLKKNGML